MSDVQEQAAACIFQQDRTGVTLFALSFAVEHDAEASTVQIVAFAAETAFKLPRDRIVLRPEHNNPVDALRIIMSPDICDQDDYDAAAPEDGR